MPAAQPLSRFQTNGRFSVFEDEIGAGSQKGMTRPAFTSLDALQEKGVTILFQSLEKGERGFQIHQEFLVNWNNIALLGKAAKLTKGRLNHRFTPIRKKEPIRKGGFPPDITSLLTVRKSTYR